MPSIPGGTLSVNFGNSITSNLIGCWVPGPMGGADLSLNGVTLTKDTNYANASCADGIGMNPTQANSGLYNTGGAMPASYGNWTNLTMWVRFAMPSAAPASGDGFYFLGIFPTIAGGSPFTVAGLTWAVASTETRQLVWNTGGTFTSGTATSLAGVTPGNMVDWFGEFTVNGAVAVYGAVDGVTLGQVGGTNSFGASAPTSTTLSLGLGTAATALTQFSNAVTPIAAIWNRLLSLSEMQSLHFNGTVGNPYQFIVGGTGLSVIGLAASEW